MIGRQISFVVSGLVYWNLEKRAVDAGVRPAEYARRLFEAAYTSRIAAERGRGTEDADLDRHVKQVFLLADCKPEYIATTLHIPVERVKRIIEGWRKAAQERPKAPAPAGKSAVGWAGDQIETARRMWAEGKRADEIAAELNKTRSAVNQLASQNRDMFPYRYRKSDHEQSSADHTTAA